MTLSRYIEDFSPLQIHELAHTARSKLALLSAQPNRKLGRMLGDTLLLDNLELAMLRAKHERKRLCLRGTTPCLRRERPSASPPPVTITAVEVSEAD